MYESYFKPLYTVFDSFNLAVSFQLFIVILNIDQ